MQFTEAFCSTCRDIEQVAFATMFLATTIIGILIYVRQEIRKLTARAPAEVTSAP